MAKRVKMDLRDKIFGKLVVVDEETDESKINPIYRSYTTWYCVCECGNPYWATTSRLNSGKTKSCGCEDLRLKGHDISGQKFGKLTAIERSGKIGGKNAWLCQCECGKHRRVIAWYLKTGKITSCGCSNKKKKRKSNVEF